MFSAWMKLTSEGERLAQPLEQRAIDSYRDSWADSDRCEIIVMHDLSAHDLGEVKQLRAQVAEWRIATATRLNREVA
jgi:hypothetical protein